MDLFLVSRADIFAIYPKILKEILHSEEQRRAQDGGALAKDHVHLPSDEDFQDRAFHRLLEVQRKINEQRDSGVPVEVAANPEHEQWDSATFSFSVRSSPTYADSKLRVRPRCHADNPLDFLNPDFLHVWRLDDLVKAAQLLCPKSVATVERFQFSDEHEMRRVYSMIYDVFRYKHIIIQALQDISFFENYPQLKVDQNRAWLLVFDMHLRNFEDRPSRDIVRQHDLYVHAHVQSLHEFIAKHKINVAAALSRLRIRNGALLLSQLLPPHLQDDKVAVAAAVSMITGWINPFKLTSKPDAIAALALHGLAESIDTEEGEPPLLSNHFKWHKVCPLFVVCVPPDRGLFSQTALVRDRHFIQQDRAFTYGPAIFCRLLGLFNIEGDIVQTHVSSPRSTAYLAALVHNNRRVHQLLAFGAGARIQEYRTYLAELGCDSPAVRIFAENYCDYAPTARIFERVVGIFCTPPNSYSGVTDPIDLICSRGGDLTMLEVLTESEMSDAGKRRVAQILEEQRETLRLSLARPQVQFCLYETHSVVGAENEAMVKRAVELVNRCARAQHVKIFRERRRMQMLAALEGVTVEQLEKMQTVMGSTPASVAAKKKLREMEAEEARLAAVVAVVGGGPPDEEDSETPSETPMNVRGYRSGQHDSDSDNETLETSRSARRSNATTPVAGAPAAASAPPPPTAPTTASIVGDFGSVVRIPKTDLFESLPVPDVCTYQDECARFAESGCFLALVKRKRITRMDDKYLIQMAERRGLFGDTRPKPKPPPKAPISRKEELLKLKQQQLAEAEASKRRKPKRCNSEDIVRIVDRLLQPTYAVSRQYFAGKKSATETEARTLERVRRERCDRDCCQMLVAAKSVEAVVPKIPIARHWWHQTVAYIWANRDASVPPNQPLRLQRETGGAKKRRGQYRCARTNIVFNDNKSI